MKSIRLAFVMVFALLLSLGACKKDEAAKNAQQQEQAVQKPAPKTLAGAETNLMSGAQARRLDGLQANKGQPVGLPQPVPSDRPVVKLVPGHQLGRIELGIEKSELERRFPGGLKPVAASTDGKEYLRAGPYHVALDGGKVRLARIALKDAGIVEVEGKQIKPGIAFDEASKLLPWCQFEAREGSTNYVCDGADLVIPGLGGEAAMEFAVRSLDPSHKKEYRPAPAPKSP